MRLIYKPIGIVLGVVASRLGGRLFKHLWRRFAGGEPPKPTSELASWSGVLAATALQAMIVRTARAVVGRYGAIGWAYLTGSWPAKRR